LNDLEWVLSQHHVIVYDRNSPFQVAHSHHGNLDASPRPVCNQLGVTPQYTVRAAPNRA
jgi:hypothetical protein